MGSRSAPQAPLPPRRIVKRNKHLFQTASSGLMAALEGNHETGKAIPLDIRSSFRHSFFLKKNAIMNT